MSPDNFFKKMTDLDSPKKNNDCYFYYYSTCVKGDSCTFRHEPSALGCETMCAYWKEGKCLNVHCNFRHMELRKNRKVIPCYWESQPVGCLKAHCPFMHQNPRPMSHDIEKASISSDGSMGPGMQNQRKVTAVDSVVVKIEEESDNESMPTFSPIKSERIVRVKTSEELKLEEIQAESAAYYSYQDSEFSSLDETSSDMRHRIVHRMFTNNSVPDRRVIVQNKNFRNDPRKRSSDPFTYNRGEVPLRKKQKFVYQNENGGYNIILRKSTTTTPEICVNVEGNNRRVNSKQASAETDIESIKIKTLEEIRAERKAKMKLEEKEEALVSSTMPEYNSDGTEAASQKTNEGSTKRKIKLRRKLPLSENIVSNTSAKEESLEKQETVENKVLDENLLESESLYEEDDRYDISLEAEEDLLNEIDD